MSIIKEWFKISKLRIAAYIRISKKEKEVNSISNQKDLIDYYIKDKEDSYLLKGLLNIYNESYPRDISNKVKTALTTKKINGEFVTSYAPYGYKKSRYEKNKIIIDTEAAKNDIWQYRKRLKQERNSRYSK